VRGAAGGEDLDSEGQASAHVPHATGRGGADGSNGGTTVRSP
jgi:hypothetical protein